MFLIARNCQEAAHLVIAEARATGIQWRFTPAHVAADARIDEIDQWLARREAELKSEEEERRAREASAERHREEEERRQYEEEVAARRAQEVARQREQDEER